MAKLFGKNKLRNKAKTVATDDILPFIAIVESWRVDYHTGTLRTDNETAREQAYNQDFFKTILGYSEKPADPYTFQPKSSTSLGGIPDAIIGHFETAGDSKNHSAVVELKGANINLDRPQRRESNLSPVQQGFKYKAMHRSVPFVIVSNFWEFRLYNDNQLDYESWTLDQLVDPSEDYLAFKSWYVLVHKDNFTSAHGQSATERLLSDIRVEQEEVGKKFYKQYKEARSALIAEIQQFNPERRDDLDFLISKAQKIIDRMIFAAFAEDMGLLPDDTLRRLKREVQSSTFSRLWPTLIQFFNSIDKGDPRLEIPEGYNGGLFAWDEDLNRLKLGESALGRVLDLSGYNFEEDLSVTILGHIFEQSITDIEALKASGATDTTDGSSSRSRRKKDGIFYTPDYIVRYIVENSLGVYLREHEEKFRSEAGLHEGIQDKTYATREHQAYLAYYDFLRNIKVVDPACGSGAFLVYVFDYLLAEHQRVGTILGTDRGVANFDQVYRSILRNNIYGVDLNEESVEIAKLSLWLKTAIKGKKLTALDQNLKVGNSLIDDPDIAGEKAFDWHEQFPEVFERGGFDVVIANPPYVRQELLGDIKPYLSQNYKVYTSSTDLFAYFYEKAVTIAKPGGVFGFISNTFSKTTGAGTALRTFLSNSTKFQKYIDFNTLTIFQDAATYPVILIASISQDRQPFEYLYVLKSDLTALENAILQRGIRVDQESLANSGWSFASIDTGLLLSKMGNHPTIRETYGKSYWGIKTGLNEAFVISSETRNAILKSDQNSNELIKPLLEGRDLARWHSPSAEKYVIYIPQGYTKQLTNLNDGSEALHALGKMYPGIVNHLKPFESKAKSRYDQGDFWWEMRPASFISEFQRNKIAWPNLQLVNKFCWDDKGAYINNPAAMLPTDDAHLLGILNSKLIWMFLKDICVVRAGGYLEVKPQYFEQIPIPMLDSLDISPLSDTVVSAVTKTRALQERDRRFQKLIQLSYLGSKSWPTRLNRWWTLDFGEFTKAIKVKLSLSQKDDLLPVFEKYKAELTELDTKIAQLDREIDQLVYQLYDLTPEEIALVEASV